MSDVPVIGGGSLNIPTDDTGTPSIYSMGEMARRALTMLGIQDDEFGMKVAMQGIQRAITKVQVKYTFDFTSSVETDTTLVAEQQEYPLGTNVFAVKECCLVDDSVTPVVTQPLRDIEFDQAIRLFNTGGTGTPGHWTVRDLHKNRKLWLLPAADAAAVDKWKLRVYFHERIERPPLNDPDVEIAAPEELSEVLITFCQAHLCFVFASDNPAAYNYKEREAKEMLSQFKGSRNRTTPGVRQIRMEGLTGAVRYGRRGRGRWGG